MNETFETTDIVIAAVLKTLGYSLETIVKMGQKGIFIFKNVDNNVISDYGLGKLLVEPYRFNNEIKSLTTSVRRLAQT